jgi:hypothetical protein
LEALMTQARLRNFVNGKHTDPLDGTYSDVVDPSTGEVYAQAPVSSAAEVDEALTAASESPTAFPIAAYDWRPSACNCSMIALAISSSAVVPAGPPRGPWAIRSRLLRRV